MCVTISSEFFFKLHLVYECNKYPPKWYGILSAKRNIEEHKFRFDLGLTFLLT